MADTAPSDVRGDETPLETHAGADPEPAGADPEPAGAEPEPAAAADPEPAAADPAEPSDPFATFVREAKLKAALARSGLELRTDSKLSSAFIHGLLEWPLERVVDSNREMWWLFNHTEYTTHCKQACERYAAEYSAANIGCAEGQAWSVGRSRGEPEARAKALEEKPMADSAAPGEPDEAAAAKLDGADERAAQLTEALASLDLDPRGDSRLCRLFVLGESTSTPAQVAAEMRQANELRKNTPYRTIVRSMVSRRRREKQGARLPESEMRDIRKKARERSLNGHARAAADASGKIRISGRPPKTKK